MAPRVVLAGLTWIGPTGLNLLDHDARRADDSSFSGSYQKTRERSFEGTLSRI
jgi:hypothetical protein